MFVGALEKVEEERVCVSDSEVGQVWIPLDEVRKATTEYEFPSVGVKKKGTPR
jgi:hypothetical protein